MMNGLEQSNPGQQEWSSENQDKENITSCLGPKQMASYSQVVKGESAANHGTENLISPPISTEENSSANDNLTSQTEVQASGSDDVDLLMRSKLQTISQYKALVENAKNHLMMLKEDTITGFLILCLGDDVPEVVESSFEVILALSKDVQNLPVLKNITYMMDALRCVARNGHLKEGVRKDARNIIAELKSLPVKDHSPLAELSESMKNVMASSNPTTCSTGSTTAHTDIKNKPTDLNTTMSTMKRKSKGRETVLFLEDNVIQQKSHRTSVTQVLISVKGIISVTYDLKKNHCIIRGKRHVASEDFARAVASLGLANVYLVRKDEHKEEVKILVTANDQENFLYPAYPEEQENEEIDDSAAVARKDQLPADDASFFKSAKNFIKRSFYW